jgi:hypothetical protein
LTFNKRDKQENEAIASRILSSKTLSGETVSSALDYAHAHIPFVLGRWRFVYARSGTEYAILSYGVKPEVPMSLNDELSQLHLFDYDIDPDPLHSVCNSAALGYLVWRVDGKSAVPCGRYANVLALNPQAFVWSVNDSRQGFADSGYDPTLRSAFSFLSELKVGSGTLADYVDPAHDPSLTFYWNIAEGYVLHGDSLPCPPRTVGRFLLRGQDCEARAASVADISGTAMPFEVIRAVRNYGFVNGMVAADISIAVDGGKPEDWLATAVYVAEHSIINGVTFSTVSVFVPNQWDDFPPQHDKMLAKVYYGPDPSRSPWKEPWGIFGASHAGTTADIEYYKIANDLIDDPDKTPDPDERLQNAETKARQIVIRKFGLPKDWRPAENLGVDGRNHERDHVHIAESTAISNSMGPLVECLTTNQGTVLLKGCIPRRR